MHGIVLFIHIVVCVLLVVVVLLQSGKSADLAGAFGGAGSQSTFGPRGAASFLSKLTTTLAVLFMVTSLSLWILAANKARSGTVLQKDDVTQQQAPAQTETPKKTATEGAAKEADKKETDKKVDKKEETKEKEGTSENTNPR